MRPLSRLPVVRNLWYMIVYTYDTVMSWADVIEILIYLLEQI